MHDLTKLTQKIRNEGLTPENRQRIRQAHKAITTSRPSPAATPATAPEEITSTAAKSREAMLDSSTRKPVSASAAEARQKMIGRNSRTGQYSEYLMSGYDG